MISRDISDRLLVATVTITLAMPTKPTRFEMRVLGGGDGNVGSMLAHIDFVPPENSSSEVYTVPVGIDYSPKPHQDHVITHAIFT